MKVTLRLPCGLLLALACAGARADVIAIPAERDNTLWNDPAGATSSGSGAEMIVGRAGGMSTFPIRRGLIAFDVASYVPGGATINACRVVLVRTNGNNVPRTIELHRVLAHWGEGASVATSGQGAPAESGDATWVHRYYPGTAWSSPGGDFELAAIAATTVDGPGSFTWGPNAAMTADVQAWLDTNGAADGWMLKDADETPMQTTHVFATRESTDVAARPLLVIDFTPPQSTFAYCVAKPNGLGCTPAMGWSGAASASQPTGFVVSASNVLSQTSGALRYSTIGASVLPLYGGSLCLQAPLRRCPVVAAGGNPLALDCSGVLAFDFNARIAAGVDPALVAGATVWCQYQARDPLDATGVSLSNALRFEIAP